ncbi:hypothetical protein ACWNX6_00785 [Candidatus Vidania fulgoroideorum]
MYSTFLYKSNKHFYVYILNNKKIPIFSCSTNNKIVKNLYEKNKDKRFYKIYCLSEILSSMLNSRNINMLNFNSGKYKFKCKIKALFNYLIIKNINIKGFKKK